MPKSRETNLTIAAVSTCGAILLAVMLAGCSSRPAQTASQHASENASPAASTCPSGVIDKVRVGAVKFDMDQDGQAHAGNANDTPLPALVPIAAGSCVVDITLENGAAKSHGTVFFVPSSLESEVVTTLTGLGYAQISDMTWTQGGQITSGGVTVTVMAEDGWASNGADFTGMFPESMTVVEAEVKG